MLRFAANLTTMFNEAPFLERFARAAQAGFRGVEFLFPYEHPPEDLALELRAHRLENVLFNLPPGNWHAGDRGLAALPGREAEFRESVGLALHYARTLGTRRMHVMAGLIESGADRATYIDNLKYAAAAAGACGVTVLIEPINRRDMPGYFLNTQAEAHAIRETVGSEHLQVQMDLYHVQVTEGDVATKIRRYLPNIGHIQIAGVPDRQEPDAGELNYPFLFQLLDTIGYGGWIGCEYRPAGETAEGLNWLHIRLKPAEQREG